MTHPLHTASVPVFNQMLEALSAILAKADAHCTDKKIDPTALLQARLFPSMFALTRQVQIASDFAKGVVARMAGVEMPAYEDNEQTLADLQARIAKTLAFINGVDAAKFTGSETREIVLMPGTARERRFPGQTYVLHYGLPQFFFHVTTAYDILRHNGVELSKGDYMGKIPG